MDIPLLSNAVGEHIALCFVSLNSHTLASASYPGEGTRVSLERFMLRDKTLLKSLHDGPCQPLSCSQSRRDDTSSPWKPITQVHPVYYPRERDTQDEWLLYSLFAAWLYVLLKFHKMENRRIVNVVRLIDIDVAGERKSRTPRAFAARPFYNAGGC